MGHLLLATLTRELRTQTRYPLNAIALALMPVLAVLPFWLLSIWLGGSTERFQTYAGATDFEAYIVVGVILWWYLQSVMMDATLLVYREIQQGTLERLLTSSQPLGQIFAAHALAGILRETATTAVSLGVVVWVFKTKLAFSAVLLALLLLAIVAVFGVGLILGAITVRTRSNAYTFMVTAVLAFLAGPAYSVDVFPNWLRWLAYSSPMTHGLQAARLLLVGGQPPVTQTLAVLAAFAAVLVPAGLWLVRATIEQQKREGGLGGY